ncbi:MAG: response regulator transcription factor [Anaerolineae bacterium]|jgi:DNA-binding NarL/FixJ family response regulator
MRIFLADHQAKERAALKRLLGQDPELCLVGEAAEVESLLTQAEVIHPDLVLLDWELPGLEGAGFLPTFGVSLKVVAFSEHVQARQEALAAGVDAFVSKQEPVEELLNMVRAVGRLSPCFV